MRLPLALLLVAGAAAAAGEPSRTQATPVDAFLAGVRRTVLPNGLTVLTAPQPGTGIVAIDTWVKAGYFHEPDEVAGMAHLFEHMFFKGSRRFPGATQIAQEVSAAGGVLNAGTIYDSTNYYFVLPKEGFRRGIEIQADAILSPLFDAGELKKEAEVVIEESNRKLDNPPAVAEERLYATAFNDHRIRRWRIGSNEVLRNIRRENLLAFFETLYRPQNIIVTVAGDVTHEEAVAAVREAFGPLPAGKLKKERGPKEPPQTGFRFGQSAADITQGYSTFGWHTVPVNDADETVLDVVATLLGTGRSSRLYKAVIGPDAASSVTAGHPTFEDVGILTIQASFDERNRATVEDRVLREVARLRAHGPTPYELVQARNIMEAETLSRLESARERAQALARFEARGSYLDLGTSLRRLATITREQVRDAARRYLTTDNLTLYHYQPKAASAIASEAALARVRDAMGAEMPGPVDVALPWLASAVAAAPADAPLTEWPLANGARLVVRPRKAAPFVTTGAFFRGGRTAETAANAGITRLMASSMRKGTRSRTAAELDRAIEFLGTQVGTTVASDYFGFTVSAATRVYEPALDILADVVLNPAFPADGVSQEKHLQLAALKRSMDSDVERPFQLYFAALYGEHPYGLPSLGSPKALEPLGPAELSAWWSRNVVAEGALIVVVGDVKPEDVRRAIEARFAALPKRTSPAAEASVPTIASAPREATESRERRQTAIVIGFPAVPPSHADWPTLRLLEAVTAGLSGTFSAELRGKRSLAYVVFSGATPFAGHGTFYAYLACEASKQEEAKAALLAELRRLQADGIRAEDVERAKSYMAGVTRLRRETNAALADELVRNHYQRVGFDFTDRMLERVPALTPDDLRKVAARYLAGEDYVFAAVRGAVPPKP